MRLAWLALLGAATVFVALPAVAATTDSLDCMVQSYAAETEQRIASLVRDPGFRGFGRDRGPVGEELGDHIKDAVDFCGAEHGWSAMQKHFASAYEVARLTEESLRVSGEFSPTQIDNIDAAIASHDSTEFWQLLERVLVAGIVAREKDPEGTLAGEVALREFIRSAGLNPDDDTGLKTGIILGAMAMQRMGLREFAALRGEN